MEGKLPVYASFGHQVPFRLTPEQREDIRRLLYSVVEAPAAVHEKEKEHLPEMLVDGHPLNRLMLDENGRVTGFVACQDYVHKKDRSIKELFVYAAITDRNTGRDFLKEIPAFLSAVKQRGYRAVGFCGWNERLNRVLERYGFKKEGVEEVEGHKVDFFRKVLI